MRQARRVSLMGGSALAVLALALGPPAGASSDAWRSDRGAVPMPEASATVPGPVPIPHAEPSEPGPVPMPTVDAWDTERVLTTRHPLTR